MEENKKSEWEKPENLVTELFRDLQRHSKRWFIAFVITLFALVATNAYWIYVFNSYEYVSQDGSGINSINTGDQENIDYGSRDEN